ncbi:hypothetical protein B7O87_13095 [Cylindrospermopsis raciborskii CENA303]|uniref:Uncharacterized protein n=1 Tax=Cylindrospermopsis raciborskii CENA303 TaxID=1170769 RepID=A0A1X4G407_9CYAN|nr:hypothetical protein [Cylindrospermopsis raciborskii]OSO89157.1 hypothetical protein B7O87_13095 [Cylindrospermopsis raciborskii CENA303]
MKSPLPRKYPPEYNVSGMLVEVTPEAIANQERQRLGLGDSPIGKILGGKERLSIARASCDRLLKILPLIIHHLVQMQRL